MFPADLASGAEALSKQGFGPSIGFAAVSTLDSGLPGIAGVVAGNMAGEAAGGTVGGIFGGIPSAGLPDGLPSSMTVTDVPSF